MIIDMTEWLAAVPQTTDAAHEGQGPTEPPPPQLPTIPGIEVELEKQAYDACPHMQMSIDDKQQTVKCGKCGIWLSPVWCLKKLFYYYEQRVDWRLAEIKAYEEREKGKRERSSERRKKPREARIQTMHEHLERAAYNEYQAKLLAARASRQRLSAGKIEKELSEDKE